MTRRLGHSTWDTNVDAVSKAIDSRLCTPWWDGQVWSCHCDNFLSMNDKEARDHYVNARKEEGA